MSLEWGNTRHGITFHTLRRTMASTALNNGTPQDRVMKLGNWKSPRMVQRYAKHSDEALRESAETVADALAGLSQSVTVADGGGSVVAIDGH